MPSFLHDLVIASRSLRRSKLFTIVSITTIALAAGVAGSIFSVTDTLVLRSLPYPEADRLIAVRTTVPDRDDFPISIAEYLDYRDDSEAIEAAGAWWLDTATVKVGNGEPAAVSSAWITPSLQPILGMTAERGRTFLEEEGSASPPAVAILSHDYWMTRFGGDPDVIARDDFSIGGTPHQIVGVLREGFALPGASPSFYRPQPMPESSAGIENRSGHFLDVVARLRDDTRIDLAVDEGRRLMAAWETAYSGRHVLTPDQHPLRILPLTEWVLSDVWRSIRILIWGALLVVLLACANLSGLMLARGETRKIELGVRTALGAGFGRLARLVMMETAILAIAGGILGLGLSAFFLRWIGSQTVAAMQVGANNLSSATVDLRLALFMILLAASCGVVFGLVPSIATRRVDLTRLLTTAGGRSRSRSRTFRRGFNALVFAQLALAGVLLNGTVMLVHGFTDATKVQPGFEAQDRFAFRVRMAESEYPDGEPVVRFYENARDAIRKIPGVVTVAAARALPMRNGLGTEGFIREGESLSSDFSASQVDFQMASPDYYTAMAIPILAGRQFDDHDRAGSQRVAMVNRSAAVAYFGSVQSAIGQRIVPLFMGGVDADPFTIVGVSDDVHHLGPIGDVRPELTLPIAQAEGWVFTILRRGEFVVRVRPGTEESVVNGIRSELERIAPGVPIDEPGWMTSAVEESIAYERFLASLTSGFGALALLIAAVGVLGVVWFSVNTRWRELGVRMALGESAASILRLVMSHGLKLGIGGAIVGGLATFGLHRIVNAVVPLSSTVDPALVAIASSVLLFVVALACLIPALRAARLDPASILGAE